MVCCVVSSCGKPRELKDTWNEVPAPSVANFFDELPFRDSFPNDVNVSRGWRCDRTGGTVNRTRTVAYAFVVERSVFEFQAGTDRDGAPKVVAGNFRNLFGEVFEGNGAMDWEFTFISDGKVNATVVSPRNGNIAFCAVEMVDH